VAFRGTFPASDDKRIQESVTTVTTTTAAGVDTIDADRAGHQDGLAAFIGASRIALGRDSCVSGA
jgi:hypothetical protein